MDIRSLLVADSKSAKLIKPGKTPFHNPSPSTEATTVLSVALRKKRHDTALMQTLSD